MRILVCGGRNYLSYNKLKITLEDLFNEIWLKDNNEVITIISGESIGADYLSKVLAYDEWGDSDQVFYEGYPAWWRRYGKAAGSIRNQKMLDEGNPDLVVVFQGGNDTKDMVNKARSAGVEVMEIE